LDIWNSWGSQQAYFALFIEKVQGGKFEGLLFQTLLSYLSLS